MSEPTEAEIRRMRDRVYEKLSSNENWEHVRNNWMKPESIEWLKNRKENK